MPRVSREHSTTAARKAAMDAPIKKEKEIKKEREETEIISPIKKEVEETKPETKKEDNTVYGEVLPADEKQLIDLIQAYPKVIFYFKYFNFILFYFILFYFIFFN